MLNKTSILKGKTILVTRASGQAQDLTNKIEEHGAVAIEIPVIEFGEPSSWHDLDTALGALNGFDWLVFASSNAVRAFHNRLEQIGLKLPDTSRPRVASIGSATSKALTDLGLTVDFQPTSFVAEQFVHEFSSAHQLQGKRILWPRTNAGRKVISEQLLQLGATVTPVETYSTNLPLDKDAVSERIARLIAEQKIDVITLASSQSAKNFCHLLKAGIKERLKLPDAELDQAMVSQTKKILLAVIGPVTAETTRSLFGRVDIEAEIFNADGMVDKLLRYYG